MLWSSRYVISSAFSATAGEVGEHREQALPRQDRRPRRARHSRAAGCVVPRGRKGHSPLVPTHAVSVAWAASTSRSRHRRRAAVPRRGCRSSWRSVPPCRCGGVGTRTLSRHRSCLRHRAGPRTGRCSPMHWRAPSRPSAVTTSKASTLSQARPNLLANQPIPPSVRPPTPV